MAGILTPPAPASNNAGAGARLIRATLRTLWWLTGIGVALLALTVAALALLPLVGAHLLVITSGSMTPAIATGDAVVVTDTAPADVEAGDVIVFRGYTGEGLTTHRVIGRREVDGRLHFRTKGDANATPDADLAPADGLLGKVAVTLPAAGRPLLFLTSPQARLLLLVVPAAGLALVQVRDLWRARRRRAHWRGVLASPAQELARADRQLAPRPIGLAVLILVVVSLGVAQLTLVTVGRSGAVFAAAQTVADNSFATLDLVPPSNISATFDCGTLGLGKGILVDWDAVSSAEGYDVARSTTSGGSYTVIASVGASTTEYMDNDVNNNTTYYYVVRTTASGWTSENSVEVSETTPGSTDCLL